MSGIELKELEDRLSREWIEKGLFNADPDPSKPKFFITFPFPYMNGSLHLGHAYSAGRLDVIARYYRMKGYNVLYPWAWHWTGEAVMGVVHRLEAGDESIINRLINLDGVEPSEIERFKDPVYLVKYFTRKGKEDIIRLGLSIDWRREFHTTNIHPLYTKFVEWQIRQLNRKGYIIQEPHPVVWCPRDKSPTGDHDRLEGVGVRPEEYTLIKFYAEDLEAYLVAGTFRPETLFGVTNVWVKPDAEYVLAEVDGERWIVNKKAVEKLKDQLHRVKEIKTFRGKDLLGIQVRAPYINRVVPVLPAEFVNPNLVTGVVYSVPAHAPYDYIALNDLKEGRVSVDDALRDLVKNIEPISIIAIEGYSEFPAKDAVEKYGVKDQMDVVNLEKATREIYSEEFHKGVMKDNCLELAGIPVKEAKGAIVDILSDIGMASSMYDLPERVVCRCGTETHVKIIEDQWALKYSDENWKELAREAVNNMVFYPEELRKMFLHYIDWYEDWPCTRKTGLGTPFPLDKEWIVETLTDSTVYMAFYIIAKYYNEHKLDYQKIDDDFFDYVFHGVGDPEVLSEKLGVSPDLLREIRNEFLYWYPVDIRGSGKDLIGNHLTFFIFHHVAIFDREHWPRGISVNGYIRLEGKPMSKSTGNFISLRRAIELFGADAVRVGLLTITDGLEDPDVRLNAFRNIQERIRHFPGLVKQLLSRAVETSEISFFDKLVLSKVGMYINDVEGYLDEHKIASAGRIIFYKIPEALSMYMRIVEKLNKDILATVIESWVKMLSLYAPYISEVIWRDVLGKDGYVALSSWPKIQLTQDNMCLIQFEEYAGELLEDIDGIVRLVNRDGEKRINKVILILPSKARWDLIRDVVSNNEELPSIKEFMSMAMNYGVDRGEAASIYKSLKKLFYGRYFKFRELLRTLSWEGEKSFLEKHFGSFLRLRYPDVSLQVLIDREVGEEYSSKARRAMPLVPAIVIETE